MQRLDYIVEWDSEKTYISKCLENRLTLALASSSSLAPTRSSSTLSQVSNLMLTLANKLATATHKASMQCSLIRASDSQAKSLIEVLSLQAITWSKIKLTADNLVLFINAKNTILSQTLSFI